MVAEHLATKRLSDLDRAIAKLSIELAPDDIAELLGLSIDKVAESRQRIADVLRPGSQAAPIRRRYATKAAKEAERDAARLRRRKAQVGSAQTYSNVESASPCRRGKEAGG